MCRCTCSTVCPGWSTTRSNTTCSTGATTYPCSTNCNDCSCTECRTSSNSIGISCTARSYYDCISISRSYRKCSIDGISTTTSTATTSIINISTATTSTPSLNLNLSYIGRTSPLVSSCNVVLLDLGCHLQGTRQPYLHKS